MAQQRQIRSIAEVADDPGGAVLALASLWGLCKQYGCRVEVALDAIERGVDVLEVVDVFREVHEQGLPGGGDLPFQLAIRLKLAAKAHASFQGQGSAPAPAARREPEDREVVQQRDPFTPPAPPAAPASAQPQSFFFGGKR